MHYLTEVVSPSKAMRDRLARARDGLAYYFLVAIFTLLIGIDGAGHRKSFDHDIFGADQRIANPQIFLARLSRTSVCTGVLSHKFEAEWSTLHSEVSPDFNFGRKVRMPLWRPVEYIVVAACNPQIESLGSCVHLLDRLNGKFHVPDFSRLIPAYSDWWGFSMGQRERPVFGHSYRAKKNDIWLSAEIGGWGKPSVLPLNYEFPSCNGSGSGRFSFPPVRYDLIEDNISARLSYITIRDDGFFNCRLTFADLMLLQLQGSEQQKAYESEKPEPNSSKFILGEPSADGDCEEDTSADQRKPQVEKVHLSARHEDDGEWLMLLGFMSGGLLGLYGGFALGRMSK